MNKEKEESAVRTAESFVRKSEAEKAFILGYMVRRMQLKDLDECRTDETELVAK